MPPLGFYLRGNCASSAPLSDWNSLSRCQAYRMRFDPCLFGRCCCMTARQTAELSSRRHRAAAAFLVESGHARRSLVLAMRKSGRSSLARACRAVEFAGGRTPDRLGPPQPLARNHANRRRARSAAVSQCRRLPRHYRVGLPTARRAASDRTCIGSPSAAKSAGPPARSTPRSAALRRPGHRHSRGSWFRHLRMVAFRRLLC